ncbi:MAG: hypothetical protein R6U66_03535 [Bacteroidales bacterium]|jgi:hypothetical protein
MSCTGCNSSSKKIFYDEVTNYDNIHGKLTTHDWLDDLPDSRKESHTVEGRFNNTRKAYTRTFMNSL